MNEKIKELAERAGPNTIEQLNADRTNVHIIDVNKFAELIVRECITIANNVHMCRDGRPVAEDIKKRFGVEE